MEMESVPSKIPPDDVSLVVALLDTNPFFWASSATSLPFSQFLHHVIPFINSLLLLNQHNRVVLIAYATSSCAYIFDSANEPPSNANNPNAVCSGIIVKKLDDFVAKDARLAKGSNGDASQPVTSSLLSGSLSLALCYIQKIFRSGSRHPQPRILCLQGSPDGPEQYVAVMNSIFSAQRSMVPIDSCIVGSQHSAFLQQASYITGGVYMKPQQLDGLFQYLAAVFATDLHSRNFLRLPKPVGVDFRASCFCHKKTIDMGYVCSVCLSIFCKYHKKCSTCGSEFNQAAADSTTPEQKR